MDSVAVLLLAAGASSRMRGDDKLLQVVDGVPLLRRQAQAMVGLNVPVIVALGPDDAARRDVLAGLDLQKVVVPNAAMGMSASIRVGVTAVLDKALGLAVLPADMPEVTAMDMRALIDAFDAASRDSVVRATGADGTPGHPVIFPSRLFPALLQLTGDSGAKPVLAGEAVVTVALPKAHALTDLDTPEDWAAWRAARALN